MLSLALNSPDRERYPIVLRVVGPLSLELGEIREHADAPSECSAPSPGHRTQPGISVILRTKTAETEVLEVIRRLLLQSRPPDEIIIIDSGSTEKNLSAFRQLTHKKRKNSDVRLIEIPPSRYQSARTLNEAIIQARFEYIAIISQDALPANTRYLEELASPLDRDSTIAGSYGRQILKNQFCAFGEKDLSKTYPATSRTQSAPDCWFVNTCSMVRRSLWEKHPFSEGAIISEDHEWGSWAQAQGYRLYYNADAVVRHYHYTRGYRDIWDRYYLEGKGLRGIYPGRYTLGRAALSAAREIASDIVWFVKKGRWGAIPRSPLRRIVKYCAYWRGVCRD